MKMAELIIDNRTYRVEKGKNLLETVLSLGLDLPYFCWHPALGSVGACRQCAVIQYKDENDDKGQLVMACMVEMTDKMRISIDEKNAREFHAGVIEWLMTNHPHDCPVCDEGGECHLQDMTVMSGHNYRRHRFKKRTFYNQDLGPFIFHEMNRCITCYRCVRFYNDYAGGNDLVAAGAHNKVYFGRMEDGTLENEFSGNLVEVCPTGVFTDKTLHKHYARKWDLQSAPSVCHHCSLGCNTLAGTRYDNPARILNRYNHEVNGYFICDRGRFGYEYASSGDRIREISDKSNEGSSKEKTLNEVVSILKNAKKIVGIGSPRASLESNFALKEMVGADNFYNGLSRLDNDLISKIVTIMQNGPAGIASLKDIETADAALVLGEDLIQTAPRMGLAVRQTARTQPMKIGEKMNIPDWNDRAIRELMQEDLGPVYIATVRATKLDSSARETFRATPDNIARLGFAIAHEIDPDSPEVQGLPDETKNLAREIAKYLQSADSPVVISGTSLKNHAILDAAANISIALNKKASKGKIALVVPECNSIGGSVIGGKALEELQPEAGTVAVIIENDIYRRIGKKEADTLFEKLDKAIVIDSIPTQTSAGADLVMPASTYFEGSGTLINNEGRAQRYFRALPKQGDIQESWRWVNDLRKMLDEKFPGWANLDEITDGMYQGIDLLKGRDKPAPPSSYRINGEAIARSPYRYSGRTAMNADKTMHEPKPPGDADAPMTFSMEGYPGIPPASLTPFYWNPGWNSVQSLNKYQDEVGGEARGGPVGVKLIQPRDGSGGKYYEYSSSNPEASQGRLLAVPVYHIFGSEILSGHASAIKTLIPKAYVALSLNDAERLNLKENDPAKLTMNNDEITLPVKIDPTLAEGLAGIPAGLEETSNLQLFGPVDITGETS